MSAAMMLITIPFVDAIGWEKGEILGYTGSCSRRSWCSSGCVRTGKMRWRASDISAAGSPSIHLLLGSPELFARSTICAHISLQTRASV